MIEMICPGCAEPIEPQENGREPAYHPACCFHDEVEDCDDRDGVGGRRYWWCNDCDREVVPDDDEGEGWLLAE